MSQRTIYNQRYRKKHPEKIKAAKRKYYLVIKANGKSKAYRKTISFRYNHYKSNAKSRGYPFEIDKNKFQEIVTSPCSYCGQQDKIGVDRIDNTKGYVSENVTACCKDCNMLKRNLELNYFIERCKKVANYFTGSGLSN